MVTALKTSNLALNILHVVPKIKTLVSVPGHDRWVPCDQGTAHPQVAVGDGQQMWRVTGSILNKQSGAADKG
jgi:hypothetical protein